MTKKFNMNDKIKNWYVYLYPTDDEMAENIPTRLTFNEFYERLGEENAYEILNVGDSIVRERVFLAVSQMLGIDYEELWDRHGKAIDKTMDPKMKEGIARILREWDKNRD